MIWQAEAGIEVYIYEAVGFKDLWLRGFCEFCHFFFFFFIIMSCVSVFSLLRAGVGGGERVGFVWVRWGARRESVEIAAVWVWEWQVDGCSGGHAENLEEWWMSGPPSISHLHKNKKGLGPKIKKKRTKKRDSNSKVRDMAQWPWPSSTQAQLWHEQPYQTDLVLCFWKRIKRFHPLALVLFVFKE